MLVKKLYTDGYSKYFDKSMFLIVNFKVDCVRINPVVLYRGRGDESLYLTAKKSDMRYSRGKTHVVRVL